MTGRLGCAETYSAAVHLRGGRVLWLPLDSDSITALTWGRKLGDYSESSVTVAKKDLPRECLRRMADTVDETGNITPGVHSWSHELSIYRDGRMAWQGPIIQPQESRTEITLDARDPLMWNDRRALATDFQPGTISDSGEMLLQIMRSTWPQGSLDDPNIAPYWRIDAPAGRRYSFDDPICPGSTTVGKLVRDICKTGIDQFCLGRKIYMIPSHYREQHAPYRLTEDDFVGELEVREGGLDFATEGYAYGQERDGQCGGWGIWPQGGNVTEWFGRVTKWRQATNTRNSQALEDMARATWEFGWPPPRAIVVPNGARLSPDAPVSVGQLVPGRPFHVSLPSYVYSTGELFRLNEVEVTWSPPDPESVQISLVSLHQPPEGA